MVWRCWSRTIGRTLAELSKSDIGPEKAPYHMGEHAPLICFVRDPDGYRVELIELGRR